MQVATLVLSKEKSLTGTLSSPPSPGDSAVSVGEGVPGAGLLPPPHGPGGALPVAGADDAVPLGQHH